MRAGTPIWRSASSATFDLLGRLPLRRAPRYPQQGSADRKVMGGAQLAAAAAPSMRPRHATQVALMELEPPPAAAGALLRSPGDVTDDVDGDVVLDDVHAGRLGEVAAAAERAKLCEHHPAARGVGADVIELVTDAFKEEREKLIAQRRRVLYDLTHPNPSDYTYKDKLVPPPPLSFGRITDEAKQLGNKVMLGQHYTLVKQAGLMRGDDVCGSSSSTCIESQQQRRMRRKPSVYDNHNFFFEINDLYQEIVLVGKASAGKSSLLNALLGQPLAKTSSTPHTTRQISFYQSVSPEEMQKYLNVKGNGLVKLPGGGIQLTFVDVPGFGIEGMSDQWRDKAIALTDAYLGVRRSVNTVFFCIDCERGLTKVDLRYFTWLENLHGVFFIILTKCDSVPHSRVCSVMRQIYSTITKNRRKYRKVFPFIIPTSAKDGTNIEFLRGLITETSGLIPGDRLRKILKKKADTDMEVALKEEAKRVKDAHDIGIEEAKTFFAALKGDETNKAVNSSSETTATKTTAITTTTTSTQGKPQKYVLYLNDKDKNIIDLHSKTSTDEPLLALFSDDCKTRRQKNGHSGSSGNMFVDKDYSLKVDNDEKVRRRHRFLAWRQAYPLQRHTSDYGTFRLNTGLEGPRAASLELPYTEETCSTKKDLKKDLISTTSCEREEDFTRLHAEEENSTASSKAETPSGDMNALNDENIVPAPSLYSSTFSVIGLNNGSGSIPDGRVQNGGGKVSRFLTLLENYAARDIPPTGLSKRQCAKEARWRERLQMGSVTRFLVEEEDGRLAEYKGGKKFGPSLVNPDDVDRRRSQWNARQYAQQAVSVRPTAPWTALEVLKKKNERVKQDAAMKGMTKKELEAYLRNVGSVTEDFEKFEGEVTTAKYMNEIRQTKTLRSQKQMHLNSTAKISYRSMPVGLWKKYGERKTYWPTPRVKGR